MKTCRVCKMEFNIAMFHKNTKSKDGHTTFCKSCISKKNKQYKNKNIDKIREARIEFRDSGRQAESSRKYRKNNRDKLRIANRIYKLNNKHKDHARSIFYMAVSSGKIIRPSTCSKCGSDSEIEGHHEDYNKPLDVMWLCIPCHGKEHRKYK